MNIKIQLQDIAEHTVERVKQSPFLQKFKLLTPSQWCYLTAVIFFIMSPESEEPTPASTIWIGFIAAIGFSRELWRVFYSIWESILGKGVLLLLYAGIANIAFAFAGIKVNEVAGVEPAALPFTVAFTAFLTLPVWFFVSTVAFSIILLLIGNLWLLFSVVVRLLGIKLRVHWEDSVFVIPFMILRIVLLPVVIVAMFQLFTPYLAQFAADSETSFLNINAVMGLNQDTSVSANAESSDEKVVVAPTVPNRVVDKAIAGFIYNFETYPVSSCKQLDNERVIPIDEERILVAQKSDDTIGYEFYVMPCIPRFSDEPYPSER